MKRTLLALLLVVALAFVINSCKKSPDTQNTPLDSQTQQSNTDNNNIQSESDQANNDVNNYTNSNSTLGGRMEQGAGGITLCGFTVDSSIVSKTLTFTFDSTQTSCFYPVRVRSGEIIVQLTSGSHWGDENAVLTLTYINYKIVYKASNTFIRFNGTKTLTNVNGNKWLQFLAGATNLEYRERAYNVKVDFSGGASATWNTARTTQWSCAPANAFAITFTANGDTSLNSYSSVDSWGVNRFGQSFTTNYNAPIVSNTSCGLWEFTSGVWVYHVNGNAYTVTGGVDSNGNAVTGTCPYGFKVNWVDANGKAETAVFGY